MSYLTPPPFQEPWTTDKFGRLLSPAWKLWLQTVATNTQVAESVSDLFTLQSAQSTQVLPTGSEDDVAVQFELSTPAPATTLMEDDTAVQLELFAPATTNTQTNDDAAMLAWLSF